MKRNTGNIDRVMLAILGLILIALAATGTVGVLGWIGIVIGIVLLLTAIFSFCPAYANFGMSTCPVKRQSFSKHPLRPITPDNLRGLSGVFSSSPPPLKSYENSQRCHLQRRIRYIKLAP
jgi:hypothetical protein